ncbi:MAG: hypothetical protein ABI768_05885 [Acidobacteriota bacterium]
MSRPVASLSGLLILGAIGALAGLAAAEAPQPVSVRADPARILKARNAMRPLGREARLGSWPLLTDAAMGELTGLDLVAERLASTYTARYGLAAAPGAGQVVVIYSSDERYRRFVESDGSPSFTAKGHAGAGLAAFALGLNPLDSRALLVHELTHLLSVGALGASIPAWLDEGLAEDLAWCRVDAEGRLQPDTFEAREIPDAWIQSARAGKSLPLAALLSPATRLFANSGSRRDATTTSAMLVRWCLGDAARAASFRAFLKSVAKGGAGDAAALAAALGTGAPELQKDFLAWGRQADSGP